MAQDNVTGEYIQDDVDDDENYDDDEIDEADPDDTEPELEDMTPPERGDAA